MMARTPIALTIAGSDSGAGAGVQADLRTFAALGVYGASAVTALTAQNTRGVRAIHLAPPEMVAAQIEAVLADFSVAAIKIGMLGSAEIVGVVAETPPLSPCGRGVGGEGSAPSGALIGRPTPHPAARRAATFSRKGRRDWGLHRLRSRHGRLVRRGAERRGLRRGNPDQAPPAGRLPDAEPRRGRGADWRAARAERRRHGAAGSARFLGSDRAPC